MVRYIRVSDRWGPVSPVRRVEAFRQDDPAEREWVRTLFDRPSSKRKQNGYSTLPADLDDAPLYDEQGKLRERHVWEVGKRMDLHT